MENLSLFNEPSWLAAGDRSYPSAPADLTTGRYFTRASSARHTEWAILRTSPANGLLVGAPRLTHAAVACFEKGVRHPFVWWSHDQSTDVPELTTGTLVVGQVDRLDASQQAQLLQWIDLHSSVQVLALAPASLFERVARGRFSTELYYRMNTVLVEMRTAADLP
jgi:hypothetical protein